MPDQPAANLGLSHHKNDDAKYPTQLLPINSLKHRLVPYVVLDGLHIFTRSKHTASATNAHQQGRLYLWGHKVTWCVGVGVCVATRLTPKQKT